MIPAISRTSSILLRRALLVGLCVAGAVRAAEPEDTGNPGMAEVTVTATRHEESLSKVPISITALTQDSIDVRGIKDFQDIARFTPGVAIDNTGTNNIAIRGIASTAGAGTTGIYLDDTPIQMRALAFNPDDALPKTFDLDRVEVLRGPQGTLFGAGSEGGTVRYITTQPSLTQFSVYGRSEVAYTQGGAPSYEIGAAAGGPLIDGKFGARLSAWYRRDGGWIDRIDPTTLATVDSNANHDDTTLLRLAGIWAPVDHWTVTTAIYYQNRKRNDVTIYWPIYSNPSDDVYRSANPTRRHQPDRFYLPSLKIEGDMGPVRLVSNTSYYDRRNTTGYDGTLYNLGFYQRLLPAGAPFPLVDATGIHFPPGLENYRSPASVQNDQQNFAQELRVQSNEPNARLVWTTGVFFGLNKQQYTEQIYDPDADPFFQAAAGQSVADFFAYCSVPTDDQGNCPIDLTPLPLLANGDSYILQTHARDEQFALYGEGTYGVTDRLKVTLGARISHTQYSFNSYTAGPQLFLAPQATGGSKAENSFTPKLGLSYQYDPNDLYYFTYAKGFRPGGGNNPVPYAACSADFANFGVSGAPATYSSDTVHSFEVGAKNSFANRVRLATSVYYIRWKNIQQTVVPPICQISFIANLGEAEVKGGDIQADVLIAPDLSLDLTAGYTDARYTRDSSLAPGVQPVAADGDAIVGQSGHAPAPFTGSLGLEYRFSALSRQAFVRADYQYESRPKWIGPEQDPHTSQFDPANFTLRSTSFLTMRAGVSLETWQVAAFVDNLTDSHTLTNYNFTIDPGTADSRLRRDITFRPRTFGLTATYRY